MKFDICVYVYIYVAGETPHLLLNGCIKVNETLQAHQAMPEDEEEVFATSIQGCLTSEVVLNFF